MREVTNVKRRNRHNTNRKYIRNGQVDCGVVSYLLNNGQLLGWTLVDDDIFVLCGFARKCEQTGVYDSIEKKDE